MTRLPGQLRMREKTEYPYPVVGRHKDHPFFSHRLPVIDQHITPAARERTSIDEYQNRPPLLHRPGRRPDIQIQAILADRFLGDQVLLHPHIKRHRLILHRARPELRTVPHPIPGHRRLRSPPPQNPHRRRRKRYPFEKMHIPRRIRPARDPSVLHLYLIKPLSANTSHTHNPRRQQDQRNKYSFHIANFDLI